MTGSSHTNADGLSMTQLIHVFDSMAERMTEVEQPAIGFFKFIHLYYRRFYLYISFDQFCQCGLIFPVKSRFIFFELGKKVFIFYTTVLDDFSKTIDPFCVGKRF